MATIQHGRHDHLARQGQAVRAVGGLSRYLVISMDDAPAPVGAELVRISVQDPDRLPLAAARNRAVAELGDCDLVVMLDVDCLPHPGLVHAYVEAAQGLAPERVVMFGPVGWLADPVPAANLESTLAATVDVPVKRDFPLSGVAREPRAELFWSLAFAVTPSAHRTIGGFDEGYAGWGAEDTDYGRRALERGMELWKVAGAWALHQPHPPSYRTAGQIDAVVHNARRFHARWGDWPMPDVLAALAQSEAIIWTPTSTTIESRREAGVTRSALSRGADGGLRFSAVRGT